MSKLCKFCKTELIEETSRMDYIILEYEIKCPKCNRIKECWITGNYMIYDYEDMVKEPSSNKIKNLFKNLFKKKKNNVVGKSNIDEDFPF